MKIRGLLIASLATLAALSSAESFLIPFTFSNDPSVDGVFDADNFDVSYDIAAFLPGYQNFAITGIEWEDVEIETVGESWLSEVRFSFDATSAQATETNFIEAFPGEGDDMPGTSTYSSGGIVPAFALLDADNLLRIHISESFDDFSDSTDATVVSGTFTLQFQATPVPEPATLAALGIGAAALLRRRKKK